MIFRATKKVLNLNKIKPPKNDSRLNDSLPGEWYVDLISLGRPGKFALHYLHHPTKIVIITQGRSLNKTKQEFKIRLVNYLRRHGYSILIPEFDIESELAIYPTNDKGMIAVMNGIKWNSEHHCINSRSIESINYNWIEDISIDNLFKTKKTGNDYLHTKTILDGFKNDLS